ncbi:unnamed protein product [Adineta ricciae]|uniref:HAT C-terminal dimerisation domain-containing protein n=1 Tax=Adineta ricciae TaxID=249248 RepID=A0A816C3Y9_ADIRI|nr:unnamed protein product [Adineta ricciae]CAF1617973.1 unnamed protein product [Adineta ricciae]
MSNHIKACKKKDQPDTAPQDSHVSLSSKNDTPKRISSKVKKLITDACVEFSSLDNRPFETVKGAGFLRLMEAVFAAGQRLSALPSVQVTDLIPDSTTISRNINQVYKLRTDQLIQWCKTIDSYCITVDFWTEGHTGIHFGGISLHHIDKNNQLHVFILGCYPYDESDQKAPSVRTFVERILDEYGLKLDDGKYVMSDNENKMKSTFNFKCKRIGCSSHYLNKQLEHGFTSETIDKQPVDCTEVQELFDNIKALIAHIRRSHKQLKLSRKLQVYSETRFNGAFYMLNVFLVVFDELFPIINGSHLENYIKIDKTFLQEVCEFLVPFDNVFQQLSVTDRPTLHRVIPLRQYLLNSCKTEPEDHSGIKKLKEFLRKRIEKCWILEDEHYLATIVHPRLKHFHMGAPGDKEKAVHLLKLAIQNQITSKPTSSNLSPFPDTTANNMPCNKYSNLSNGKSLLAQCFDQVSNPEPFHIVECEEYLNSTTNSDENDDDNILEYWTKQQNRFPNIHSLARKVLAIPASNTEVERLFSCSKMVVTDNRTRLDAEKLNKIIFLRKNLYSLKQLEKKEEVIQGSQKRKSMDEWKVDSEGESEGEQRTPSIVKRHRIGDNNSAPSEDELEE